MTQFCHIWICTALWFFYTHTHTHIYTHTMEYYSDIKKNETLTFAATWMALGNIMLSEISQTKTNIL